MTNHTLNDALNRAWSDEEVLKMAVQSAYRQYPDPCNLLGVKTFTLRELQLLHEDVLEEKLSKDSFRRFMVQMLEDTGEVNQGTGAVGKPARLFRKRPMFTMEA